MFEALLKFSRFYQVHSTEEWVCRGFEDGLRPELKQAMLPLEFNHFLAMVVKCTVLEGHDCTGISQQQQRSGGPVRDNNQRGRGGRFQSTAKPYVQSPYSADN